MKIYKSLIIFFFLVLVGTNLLAQEGQVDKAAVPFSDPAKPGTIHAYIYNGSITLIGYEGKEVKVEAICRTTTPEKKEDKSKTKKGLPRLNLPGSSGMTIEEMNNIMEIYVSHSKVVDLKIQAPHECLCVLSLTLDGKIQVNQFNGELQLKVSKNGTIQVNQFNGKLQLNVSRKGEIFIKDVTGELEIDNTYGNATIENLSGNIKAQSHSANISIKNCRGEIEANVSGEGNLIVSDISGTLIANTTRGNLTTIFTKVEPEKPMSFSTYSGDIDITLPSKTKARLKMKTSRGNIYTDFDIKPDIRSKKVDTSRGEKKKYTLKFENEIIGIINGGGPEYTIKTISGDILIRKAK
jgi:hypothetical protein